MVNSVRHSLEYIPELSDDGDNARHTIRTTPRQRNSNPTQSMPADCAGTVRSARPPAPLALEPATPGSDGWGQTTAQFRTRFAHETHGPCARSVGKEETRPGPGLAELRGFEPLTH